MLNQEASTSRRCGNSRYKEYIRQLVPKKQKYDWEERLQICFSCEFFSGKNCSRCGCQASDHAIVLARRECPEGLFPV